MALAIQVVSKDVPVNQLLPWRKGYLLLLRWGCSDQAKRAGLVATAQVFRALERLGAEWN